jgi:hypothetical protein
MVALAALSWLNFSGPAPAADLPYGAGPAPWAAEALLDDPANHFEARFGVFAHGVGGNERNTVALNGEIVSPRLFNAGNAWWAPAIPRIHAGGFVNVQGRTNSIYTGLLWTIPVYDRLFFEAFIGPSVHDGSLTPGINQAGLGCRVLFNAGASIGYRFDSRWSVMGTFNHLSNGKEIFGTNCGLNQLPGGNQGLNHYGLRVGYTF